MRSKICIKGVYYIFLLLRPVDRKVLYTESFIEVRYSLGDSVDDVRNLIGDDELDILNQQEVPSPPAGLP